MKKLLVCLTAAILLLAGCSDKSKDLKSVMDKMTAANKQMNKIHIVTNMELSMSGAESASMKLENMDLMLDASDVKNPLMSLKGVLSAENMPMAFEVYMQDMTMYINSAAGQYKMPFEKEMASLPIPTPNAGSSSFDISKLSKDMLSAFSVSKSNSELSLTYDIAKYLKTSEGKQMLSLGLSQAQIPSEMLNIKTAKMTMKADGEGKLTAINLDAEISIVAGASSQTIKLTMTNTVSALEDGASIEFPDFTAYLDMTQGNMGQIPAEA